MVRSSVSALMGFAAVAAAVNQPPPVPQDAQIGDLAFPVTCEIYGFLQQTFQTVFTATAPVFGGSGQEIYYTDVVGTIDIPSYITGLAPLVNAHQASANITVYLNLENASPSNLLVYQATINNITFPSSGDAFIRIPQGNGTLPPLGPVTLGTADVAHRILLGDVTVSIELQDASGNPAFGPVPVSCGQQQIDYILGSVNVDNSQGPPLAPANGYVPIFPNTPSEFESGSFRFPYECDFQDLGNYPLDLEISGTVAAYFAPGEQFSLTNAQSFLRVPENLTSLALEAFPQATNFHTTINSFDILFKNAQPASYNVAAYQTIVSDAAIPASGQLVILIPETGSFTIGPVTAGSNGEVVGIAVGTANATVAVQDNTGKTLLTLNAVCNVPAPLELIGIPITTVTPTSYSLGIAATATSSSSAGSLFGSSGSSTTTSSAAAAATTGAICFDAGDCILSGGGQCVKASGAITGNCS